jgi:hypothetical protein
VLSFNSKIGVVVCTRTFTQERWLSALGRVFQNFTATPGIGGWVGEQRVETERNLLIETWGPDWSTVRRALRLAAWLQKIEQQEAISVVWSTPEQGFQARVVFEADWEELGTELRQVFDPLYREECRVEELIQYFEKKAGGESLLGCDVSDHHWQ